MPHAPDTNNTVSDHAPKGERQLNNAESNPTQMAIDGQIADETPARRYAMQQINAIIGGELKIMIGLDQMLFGPGGIGKKSYLHELKKIMLQESGDKALIAAYMLLEFNIEDIAAIKTLNRFLDEKDFERCKLAMSYVARLSGLPPKLIPALLTLLHGSDPYIRISAAIALRDSSQEALDILVKVLRGDDCRLKMLAASALGRVDKSARPNVGMDEIIAAITQQIEALEGQEQFAAVALIKELGPEASMAAPVLIRMLGDPEVKLATRTVIICLLGATGLKNETVNALLKAQKQAILVKNWVNVLYATQSIVDLGAAPAKAIDNLLDLLRESDKESQLTALKSLRYFGGALQPSIGVLIDHSSLLKDREVATAWGVTMGAIGPSAVRPLIQLLHSSSVELFPWVAGALQGTGDEGSTEFVNLLFTDPNKDVREFAAMFLNTRGKKAEAAIPAIISLLERDDGEKHVESAIMAFKGMGASAARAAPALVRFLVNGSAWTNELARDGLHRIGPDAIPALRDAFGSADVHGKERIKELLERWKFPMEEGANSLEWFQNDKLLEFFAAYGQRVQNMGATSGKKIAAALGIKPRTVQMRIEKLEAKLAKKEGRAIRLTERSDGKKGGLTENGLRFLAQVLAFQEQKRDRQAKG